MQTKRLTIRKFRGSDIQNLYLLISDTDVMRYLEAPYSFEEAETFMKRAALPEPPLIYAVDDRNGRFIGYVIYHPYDESSFEIGWVLHRKEWHKGYAQELTEAMIEDASRKKKNLIIECVPEQTATRRIAANNGFHFVKRMGHCEVYQLSLL